MILATILYLIFVNVFYPVQTNVFDWTIFCGEKKKIIFKIASKKVRSLKDNSSH